MKWRLPFMLRRPVLLLRDLVVNRERPDLDALRREDDPESFVWKILPHAARTFSACIALLPTSVARASAVAYLYCRCLDSYEDMLPEHQQRQDALREFYQRLGRAPVTSAPPAPRLADGLARDERDLAHIVLVNRSRLVDRVFFSLDAAAQRIVLDLVRGMAEGMIWSSHIFARQKGVLTGSEQLRRYCGYVLGLPTIFAARIMSLYYHDEADLTPLQRENALLAGEMVQLANITRDIEKDLRRGVAYHPHLKPALEGGEPSSRLDERVRQVRRELLLRALMLAPAYRQFVEDLRLRGPNFGRASAILMLLFTDRYYRSCAVRLGRKAWEGPRSGLGVILKSLPAVVSLRWSRRVLREVERSFLEFAESEEPGLSAA
ncbi:MAG TPA: squalene/phytoene synthase family protein [Acidobacteriota bacterium]|nr:squalene/phytoene synthase family protein [Acidobacteriota bacterium]